MAFDKVVDSAVLNNGLTAIADAIRAKSGKAEMLRFPDGFEEAILGIGITPEGYKKLDHIETTGTQYIDTGVYANNKTRIVCEYMHMGADGAINNIYGARTSTTANNFSLRVVSNLLQAAYGTYIKGTVVADHDWHTVDHDMDKFYLDGELVYESDNTSAFETPRTLCIGAIRTSSNVECGKAKHRSYKIYDNGTLVRYFWPYADGTGRIGMLDMVHGEFYPNAGTGEFVAGMIAPTNCLTFSSPAPFTIATLNGKKNWNGALYYSTDAEMWIEWDGVSTISSGEDNVLHVRGVENSIITTNSNTDDNSGAWVITGENVRCDGNVECLLDYKTVARGEHPVMAAYCFNRMFYGCEALVKGPELGAVTLSNNCYRSFFNKCTNLSVTPELPATTLGDYCYYYMFAYTGITELPALYATELESYCYNNMFRSCANIKLSKTKTDTYNKEYRIPWSGEGKTATSALDSMFYGTGGSHTSVPSINTVYYTANEIVGVKEESAGKMMSTDGYALTDQDGNYLIPKEDE